MRPVRFAIVSILAAAAASSPLVPIAHAAEYPARPVRLIVPFPPSGGTDIVGRVIAQQLGDKLGHPFVIDNRPGAASTIGASIAAKAPHDGYTLLLVTASYAMSANYYKELPYDSIRDFAPVSLLVSGPLVVVVHPAVRASSVKELIALAKAAPGKLNYSSGGAGGINHLAGEMFNTLAGTRLVHVPYKGAGPALTALVSGEVQMMIATLGSCLPLVRSGKLKALAVGGTRRAATLPDLPTVAESGVPGFNVDGWYGMLAPRGTPASVITQLNREITAILGSKDVEAQMLKLGFEPMSSTPAEFGAYLRREIEKWGRVMKASGLSPETTP